MQSIRLLFAGDFCPRYKALDYLYSEKIQELTKPVKEIINRCDVSIVNVETVFTDESCESKKSGPNLKSPIKAISLLKEYGFTIGALANNHTCDQGEILGLRSKELIEKTGMLTLGYGKNIEDARNPVRLETKGKKISFLNYAENEFVAATKDTPGFSPIDYYDCAKQVREEKKDSDFVFVFLHAGNEECPLPRNGVRKLCYHLIESGADGVIISHPHCPQGMECYQGKPIAYSLGNFFMPRRDGEFSIWNTGYMAEIIINEKGEIALTPIPYAFGVECEYFRILTGEEKEQYMDYLSKLSKVIVETDALEYQKLLYAWSLIYQEDVGPMLERFVNDKKSDGSFYMFVRNALSCESHNELWTNYYKIFTEGKCDQFEAQKEVIRQFQACPILQ